jgi:predicted DsbA family dithiol-disulfide isomerase
LRPLLALVALAGLAVAAVSALGPPEVAFEPWSPAPPLRTVESGAASVAAVPALVGLDAGDAAPRPAPPREPCRALHAVSAPGRIPVAFFTDHRCPQCRAVERLLEDRDDVAVTTRRFPLLGADSVRLARAAIAARLQGAEAAFDRRMQRAVFAPTDAYLADIARGLDLDAARFLADVDAATTARLLAADIALGRSLGFGAVPTTVVGGTVVLGNVGAEVLSRVVAAEARGPSPCDGA